MSTPNIGVLLGRYDPKPTAQSSRLSATFAMLTPSQGWATVAILLLTMVVVSESINAAEWVDADGLTAVLLWSGIVALALAKVRISWILLMPAGMVVGAVAILWQAARGVEGETAFDRMRETFIRLDVWWEAAIGGGISTDLLPFFIMLLVIAWVIGFLSSWFIFRNNNAWIAVVLLGTATLTNLSFLPDRFAFRFFLFVFLAMILVVRMSVIQRHERWRQLSVRFAPVSGWLTLHATVWFSIVVLIAAVALPMRIYTNEQIAELWSVGRAPVATAEDFFSRLFAALPTKKDQPGRFFGKWLPFIGKISFGGEPVAWAVTDYPSYWLSRTYNYYTSKGWAATDTVDLDIGPDVLPPPRGDNLKRVPENQLMQLGFRIRQVPCRGELRLGEQSGDCRIPGAQEIHHRHERFVRRCGHAIGHPGTRRPDKDERGWTHARVCGVHHRGNPAEQPDNPGHSDGVRRGDRFGDAPTKGTDDP